MRTIRVFVLSLRHLPVCMRFFSVIFAFVVDESLISASHNWGISSILLIPGVLACWIFPWRAALALEWGLLWIHLALIASSRGWSGYVVQVFISGTITDFVLVGSFGALRTSMDQSQEFHRIKDQWITNLNHDFRNPLTGIMGSLDILKRYGDRMTKSECQTFLDQAMYSCEEMERMTSNIRAAIHAKDDIPQPRCEPFWLDHVVSNMLRYIYTFDHPLSDLCIEDSIMVLADPQQVQQVLRNLLHNAFKYAPENTPVSVQLGCDQVNGCAYVCVRDKGSGIAPEQIPHLFQKFSRLGESRVDGTGLGLYNCRRMVENMAGQIWVESTGIDGEGSSFFFTLPLCPEFEIPTTG